MAAPRATFDWQVFLHRYVGLVVGLWLFAIGSSGAILAYYREIDVFLNPDLFIVKDVPQNPDLDAMIANVRTAYPDRFVLYLERYAISHNGAYPFILSKPMPRRTDGNLDLSSIGNFDAAMDFQVFVDPATTQIIGTRSYWTVINILRDFHRELFAPPVGRKFLRIAALSLLITTIIGGLLWWRDARKHTKRALTIRLSSPTPRLIHDSHTVVGIYAIIVIGWMSLSATVLTFSGPLREMIHAIFFDDNPPPFGPPRDPELRDGAMISLNIARDVALAYHPNSEVALIRMPKSAASRYSVRFYPTDEPYTLYTRQIEVDAATGEVTKIFDPAKQHWVDSLLGVWMIWFHNGTMLGDVGRVFNIFAGIVLASLFPTGIYIWWKKRRARVVKKSAPVKIAPHTAAHPAE